MLESTQYASPVMNGLVDAINIAGRLGLVRDINMIRDTIEVHVTNYNIEARRQGKAELEVREKLVNTYSGNHK